MGVHVVVPVAMAAVAVASGGGRTFWPRREESDPHDEVEEESDEREQRDQKDVFHLRAVADGPPMVFEAFDLRQVHCPCCVRPASIW